MDDHLFRIQGHSIPEEVDEMVDVIFWVSLIVSTNIKFLKPRRLVTIILCMMLKKKWNTYMYIIPLYITLHKASPLFWTQLKTNGNKLQFHSINIHFSYKIINLVFIIFGKSYAHMNTSALFLLTIFFKNHYISMIDRTRSSYY